MALSTDKVTRAGVKPKRPEVDRSSFLDKPEFWGLYYYMILRNEERESADRMLPCFGVSDHQVELTARYFCPTDNDDFRFIDLTTSGDFTI